MEHSFVGIDVAKDHLDVHVRPTGEVFRVTSDDAGLAHAAHSAARAEPHGDCPGSHRRL